MLRTRFISLGLLSALMLSALAVDVSSAADHRDAPALTVGTVMVPPGGPPVLTYTGTQIETRRLDLNDIYVFQSPSNPNNTVLMATVNPLLSPGDVAFFSSTGVYEFKISNGANATTHHQPEITIACKFTAPRNGRQEIRVTRTNHVTNRSELIARGLTGSNIAVRGGGQLRADLFDDPFFFDFLGFTGSGGTRDFNDGREFDFFAGTNVGIIVLEIPSISLTGGNLTNPVITVWGRTLSNNVQIDRTAVPVLNPVLVRPNRFLTALGRPAPMPNTPPLKDRFNLTEASNDRAMWGEEIRLNLIAFGNTDEPIAPGDPNRIFTLTQILDVVSPDVLTFNVTSTAGFNSGPLNGRRLEDDVIDLELQVIVQAVDLNGDGIDANDKSFLTRFPYVAPKH